VAVMAADNRWIDHTPLCHKRRIGHLGGRAPRSHRAAGVVPAARVACHVWIPARGRLYTGAMEKGGEGDAKWRER